MTAVSTDWCTLHTRSCLAHHQLVGDAPEGAEAPSAYGEGRAPGTTAFSTERLKGLSCLRGNSHEQFLGGWAGAIPSGYPILAFVCHWRRCTLDMESNSRVLSPGASSVGLLSLLRTHSSSRGLDLRRRSQGPGMGRSHPDTTLSWGGESGHRRS